MRVTIDIDGTLTAWPAVLDAVAKTILGIGGTVVLLTGCTAPDPATVNNAGLVESRRRQVRAIPGAADMAVLDIVVCVGRDVADVADLKGAYCRDHGVTIVIDDAPEYCAAIRRLSPQTLVLQVVK